MKLSQNFDLAELIASESAKRHGISNMPNPEQTENLILLCKEVLEPIRIHFGVPILISSGFRSLKLNQAIGGRGKSQHMSGEAVDIDMDGTSKGVSNEMIFNFIKDNLKFDQLINEFNYSWVHVSFSSSGKQRNEILKAIKTSGGITVYQKIKR